MHVDIAVYVPIKAREESFSYGSGIWREIQLKEVRLVDTSLMAYIKHDM